MKTILLTWLCTAFVATAADSLPLAGEWRFALDRADAGMSEQWFAKKLADKIQLPGALQSQGYGDEVSTNTPWVLSLYDKNWFLRADYTNYATPGAVKVPFVCQPPRHYLGAAWYQRDIEIPADWAGKRVVLFLERPHWESRAWVDDQLIGTNNSLCVAHEFELGVGLKPGKHTLTLRVDNRMILPYRPDAHSVSDSLAQSWNGIVGKMELRATSPVWIADVQVYPEVKSNLVTVKLHLGNLTGKDTSVSLQTTLRLQHPELNDYNKIRQVTVPASGCEVVSYHVLSPKAALWDEFHPGKESVLIALDSGKGVEETSVSFGLRDFQVSANQFTINDCPTYIRGTHSGGDFPLTGYPPTDVAYWRKLFATCKEWGLNSMRFHSFCPPEAAFTAADELGFYLYVEAGMWNTFDPGSPMEAMLYTETERIIKAYGNHPSFVMLSPSNEPKGHWTEVLPKWAEHYRAADSRRLYTTASGFTDKDCPGPLDKVDFTTTGRIVEKRVRGISGWLGKDYTPALSNVNVPVITHELGQWCAYPDFDVIKKFTGYMRPGNYEIYRDSAAANGVLEMNKEFASASGALQFECYKEEIEANLRTPGLAGFQLLDLHDYVGQGTALVGLLDTFWESKGYVSKESFRFFCNSVVPLARLKQRVFTTTDKLEVPVMVANFGESPVTNAVVKWSITPEMESGGKVPASVRSGQFDAQNVPLGRTELGAIVTDLAGVKAPGRYLLTVGFDWRQPGAATNRFAVNSWKLWVYPAQVSADAAADVFVTSSWDAAETKLASGGKVLFLPRKADLDWSSPTLEDVPIFWNRLMNPQWGRMLGLWCDMRHPALAEFPTHSNCDWQWTQIINRARTMNLAKLPRSLTPIVSAIDDWNRNWKLGVVLEAKVGKGKLMVCTLDLKSDLDARPVARQLRRSLLDYMATEKFQPKTEVLAADFRASLFDTLVMKKLGATVSGDGANLDAIMDGDPNTFWQSGGGGRGKNADTRKHPHELVFTFTNAVAMDGVTLMPRQNDRDHLGDVRGFKIEASYDGTNWTSTASGELVSTWSPQTVKFSQRVTARQLRFTALSGFGNDTSAALAELAVIYAGQKLPENTDTGGNFKRIRSTSSDVDEAPAVMDKPTKR